MEFKPKRSIKMKPRALMLITMGSFVDTRELTVEHAEEIDRDLAKYMKKHNLIIEVSRSEKGLTLVFGKQPNCKGFNNADNAGNG